MSKLWLSLTTRNVTIRQMLISICGFFIIIIFFSQIYDSKAHTLQIFSANKQLLVKN